MRCRITHLISTKNSKLHNITCRLEEIISKPLTAFLLSNSSHITIQGTTNYSSLLSFQSMCKIQTHKLIEHCTVTLVMLQSSHASRMMIKTNNKEGERIHIQLQQNMEEWVTRHKAEAHRGSSALLRITRRYMINFRTQTRSTCQIGRKFWPHTREQSLHSYYYCLLYYLY